MSFFDQDAPRHATKSKRRSYGKLALLVLGVLAALAAAVLINGWLFEVAWNDFVVGHVTGARRTSYANALVAALLLTVLFGRGSVASRRK